MNYPHPFMMGQIPISQQMAMMAQQQQQQQQQQQHQQMLQQHQPMPQPPMQQQGGGQMSNTSPGTRAQKKRRRKDPNSPKRAMSAYFMFVQKERQEMEKRGEKIAKVTEFTKAVSEKWRRMSPVEREPYDRLSEKDKERYEAEMVAFTGKKKDVNKPKKPQTAYFLWLAGWREHNKDKFDHKELLRQAGLVWNRLTDVDKAPYLRAAEEEKHKYEGRMREYTAGLSANKPPAGPTGAKQAKMEAPSAPLPSAPSQAHQQPPQMNSSMPGQQQQQQPLPGMGMQQAMAAAMSPQSMPGQHPGNINMMNYAAAQQAAMAQQFHQMATAYYQQQQQQQRMQQMQQPGGANHHDNGDDDDEDDDDDDEDDDDGEGSE